MFSPKLGMRVKCISSSALMGRAYNQTGIISYIYASRRSVIVRFDNFTHCDTSSWSLPVDTLMPLELTPDEQDKQRRENHAEKYL